MKIEDQVVSLPLARRLQELDVKHSSLFYWVSGKTSENINCFSLGFIANIFSNGEQFEEIYHAYTVSELGEILPNSVLDQSQSPFDEFRISIKKFISIDENLIKTNNFIINYDCSLTEATGPNAWIYRQLTKNIYGPNLANVMAEMLIWLIENGHVNPEKL